MFTKDEFFGKPILTTKLSASFSLLEKPDIEDNRQSKLRENNIINFPIIAADTASILAL